MTIDPNLPMHLTGFLPLPYLDQHKFDAANWAEIRRLKAAGRTVYVRKLDDDSTYEIVDGGPTAAA